MPLVMELYAEVYNGVVWEAKGGNLHGRNDRGLNKLLSGRIYTYSSEKREYFRCKYLKCIRNKRLLPGDTSDEILDDFFGSFGHKIHEYNLFDDDWNEIYTAPVVRQILTQQDEGKDLARYQDVGWVNLEELNNFDWDRLDSPNRHYGEVPIKYAELFSSGEQPWPEELEPSLSEFDSLPLCKFYYPLHAKAPTPNEYVCEDGFMLVSWFEFTGCDYEYDAIVFRDTVLPLLRTYGDPKNVRLIFWLSG
jgi:hypothetical protein